ncbi:hypothetical protein V8919_17045, partial [Ralstonia mannitolilytica]
KGKFKQNRQILHEKDDYPYYTQEMMVGAYRALYDHLRTLPDHTADTGAKAASAAAAACPHHARQNKPHEGAR